MRFRHHAAILALIGSTVLAVTVLPVQPASAHGTVSDPVNRVYQCYLEGPEHPKSAACQAAVAAGGTSPLYNWNGILQPNAAGNHRAVVPDGHLCSGGNSQFAAFDAPRSDWVATPFQAGPRTIRYNATAPHRNGDWTFLLTRQGWQPNQPLRWADLEQIAFIPHSPDFSWQINIPARTGRHILYVIWQRNANDSPEAFYSCSDVDFG
jgi:chitin-binding protein